MIPVRVLSRYLGTAMSSKAPPEGVPRAAQERKSWSDRGFDHVQGNPFPSRGSVIVQVQPFGRGSNCIPASTDATCPVDSSLQWARATRHSGYRISFGTASVLLFESVLTRRIREISIGSDGKSVARICSDGCLVALQKLHNYSVLKGAEHPQALARDRRLLIRYRATNGTPRSEIVAGSGTAPVSLSVRTWIAPKSSYPPAPGTM